MTGNHWLDILVALQAVIYALSTFVGLVAPKGSAVGVFAAKVGADVKGQTVGAEKPADVASQD